MLFFAAQNPPAVLRHVQYLLTAWANLTLVNLRILTISPPPIITPRDDNGWWVSGSVGVGEREGTWGAGGHGHGGARGAG